MVMSPMTLGNPFPQTITIFAFFVARHVFVVSKRRDFVFGVQVDHNLP